jgi:hypothetical protein
VLLAVVLAGGGGGSAVVACAAGTGTMLKAGLSDGGLIRCRKLKSDAMRPQTPTKTMAATRKGAFFTIANECSSKEFHSQCLEFDTQDTGPEPRSTVVTAKAGAILFRTSLKGLQVNLAEET